MYNKNAGQPENISSEEWKLLQYLATMDAGFLLEEAFFHFEDGSEIGLQNVTLRFYRQFHHLQNAGYLAIIPIAPSAITNGIRPAYKLSTLGNKATQQNGLMVF